MLSDDTSGLWTGTANSCMVMLPRGVLGQPLTGSPTASLFPFESITIDTVPATTPTVRLAADFVTANSDETTCSYLTAAPNDFNLTIGADYKITFVTKESLLGGSGGTSSHSIFGRSIIG